jgi:2'-5' RNA ligase
MNPGSIRVFVAVEIPETVKAQVDALEAQLKKTRADITWVQPKNMHVTLKFLGDLPSERLGAIREGVQEAVAALACFQMRLAHLGAFPNLDRPRVFWIDVQEGRTDLIHLQRRVEDALCARQFVREERPFSPHLTIGRVRSPRGLHALADQVHQTDFQSPPFSVQRVAVVRSELHPGGPVYTVLDHADLV